MIESRGHFLRFVARAGRLEALVYLLSHPKERLTINQLARRAAISPATAWRATEDLYGLGLVWKEPAGRSMLVQLNENSPVVDALAKVEFPDPQLLAYEAFARRLKQLAPGATTRLFGSVAKGTARPSSDVDVLVAFGASGQSKAKVAQACDQAVVEILDSFRIVVSPLLVSRMDVMAHEGPDPNQDLRGRTLHGGRRGASDGARRVLTQRGHQPRQRRAHFGH